MESGELTPSETTLNNVCKFYGLDNHEIIFLTNDEIIERITGVSVDTDVKKRDQLKMEIETLRRKLKVVLNSFKPNL